MKIKNIKSLALSLALVPLTYLQVNAQKKDFIAGEGMPSEVALHILEKLDAQTLAKASMVSSAWNAAVQSNEIFKLGLQITKKIHPLTKELKSTTNNAQNILFRVQCKIYELLNSSLKSTAVQNLSQVRKGEIMQIISEPLDLYYQELLEKIPVELKEQVQLVLYLENSSNPTLCALNVLKNLPTPPEIEKEIKNYGSMLDKQSIKSDPTALVMEILRILEKTYQLPRSIATEALLCIPFQQKEIPKRRQLLLDFGKYLGDMKTRQASVFEVLPTFGDENEFEKSCLLAGFCKTYNGDQPDLLKGHLQSITEPLCLLRIASAMPYNRRVANHCHEFISQVIAHQSIDSTKRKALEEALLKTEEKARTKSKVEDIFREIDNTPDFGLKYNAIWELCIICQAKSISKLCDKIIKLLELGRQCQFRMADEQTHDEHYIRENLYRRLLENPNLQEEHKRSISDAIIQLSLPPENYNPSKNFPYF